ncbi:MAG: SdrD B-like domain-containing protein, partial [Parcubacteria group bacterium]
MLPVMPRVTKRARILAIVPLVFAFALLTLSLQAPQAQATLSTIQITDSSGTALTSFSIGSKLYVTVTDANRNANAATAETVSVTLTSTMAADSEALSTSGTQLVETGVNTGVFRNPGLDTAAKDGSVAANDGTLEVEVSDTLKATYTDPTDETVTFDFADSPLAHTAQEAAHIDDGSAADDPSASNCADSAVYTGTETGFDPNTAANGGYIPTDSADWDIQPGSTASNGGPTTANISTDNNTREANQSIEDSGTCHGWDLHEFEFDVSPFSALNVTAMDVDWAGLSSYAGVETQAMNDAFLMVFDRSNDNWVELDVEANIANAEGGSFTDVPLSATISSGFSDYLDSNGLVRLLVAGYDRSADSLGGALYTDYISLSVTGDDTSVDTLALGGGSIFGTVYNDSDRDGRLDSGEKGIANVSVTLQDDQKAALVTDKTDSNGD